MLLFNSSGNNSTTMTSVDDFLDKFDIERFIDSSESKILVYYGNNAGDKQDVLNAVINSGGKIINDFSNIPSFVFRIPLTSASKFEKLPGMIANDKFQMFEDPRAMASSEKAYLDAITSVTAGYPKLIESASGSGLWNDNYKGEGVKIAILDTGIDSNHSDIDVAQGNAFSFVKTTNGFSENEDISDGHGHGTHVAGIAAGKGVSDSRFIGMAPEATLINLKVASRYGNSYPAALYAAIDKAIELEVDVISISLGFSQDVNHPLALRLDEIVDLGICVVASAGNSGPNAYSVNIPGASRKTITVGSSDFNKTVSSFSSRGPAIDERMEPDIIAPGEGIVSALAYGSLMDYAVQSLVDAPNYVRGATTRDDYIAMSGTSMSAPLIAGAVALLKDKFPTASPIAIRAALMEGADEISGNEYETGAGYINIDAASSILSNHHTPQGYNNFYIHPAHDLFPWNVTLFPGDEYTVRPTILSGIPADFQLSVDNLMNGSSFMILNETSVNDKDYFDTSVKISIPLDTSPGTYIGKFTVENIANGTSKSVFLGPVNVVLPQRTVYFDLFHSLAFDDSILVNYYSMFQLLAGEGYQIDEYNVPITDTILSYDLVIIPDPEIAFSSYELGVIHDYIDNGGNLLVLSSFSPFTFIPGLNQLTGSYGIDWEDSLIANITDTGLDKLINAKNGVIVPLNSSLPFFTGVDSDLIWYAGTTLDATGNAKIAARTNGDGVYAYFEGNSTSKGRIFASSQELQFYNGYLDENDNDIFVVNVIDWLTGKDETGNSHTIKLLNSTIIQQINSTFSLGTYVTDTIGQPVSISVNTINISWIFPNGTVSGVYHPVEEETGMYLHYFNQTGDKGKYTAVIETPSGNKLCTVIVGGENDLSIEEFTLVDSIPVQKEKPSWLDDYEVLLLDRDVSRLFASADIDNSTRLAHVTLVFNAVPEFLYDITQTYSNSPLYSFETEMSYNTGLWQYSWQLTSSIPSGFYVVFIQVCDANNMTTTDYGSFLILNEEPVINLVQSSVGSTELKRFEDPTEYFGRFDYGSSISISLNVNDADSPGNVSCYYLILNVPTYIGFHIAVGIGELENNGNGIYEATVQLPTSQPVIRGSYTVKTSSDQVFAIMLIARDTEGNYDYFAAYFVFQSGFDALLPDNLMVLGFTILIIVIPPIAILYYFAVIKPRKSKRMTYEEYLYQKQLQKQESNISRPGYQQSGPLPGQSKYLPQQPRIDHPRATIRPKFCGYCGTPIVDPKQQFCMNCGEKFDFME
ncbi:MAG: S8 family serine peptidase [Candidatus Hodarchaeales archaeon]